jgi:hypothetical protein
MVLDGGLAGPLRAVRFVRAEEDQVAEVDGSRRGQAARPALSVAPSVPSRAPVDVVIVAVPARNEEDRIGECLARVDRAAAHWGGTVLTVIGTDSCTDATSTVARGFVPIAMQMLVVNGIWRRPSRARRAIVGRALEIVASATPLEKVWIANTDADCLVGPDWLERQVAMADRGVDLVAGVVTLDPSDTSTSLLASFAAHYQRSPGDRGHVHAANLGIRASAYERTGGWRASTAIGEEHHLVRAAMTNGATIVCSDELVVATSSRTRGRVRGGFASVLHRLQHDGGPVADSA